jgi:hypothetical protein
MNRNQFNDKHHNLGIRQAEIDRKWRVFLLEQEQLAMLDIQRKQSLLFSSSGTKGVHDSYVEDGYVEDDYV